MKINGVVAKEIIVRIFLFYLFVSFTCHERVLSLKQSALGIDFCDTLLYWVNCMKSEQEADAGLSLDKNVQSEWNWMQFHHRNSITVMKQKEGKIHITQAWNCQETDINFD